LLPKYKNGFVLIELLTVITIIGFLVTTDLSKVNLFTSETDVINEHSPGWHCPEDTGVQRDWQGQCDWVVGKFTNP